MDAFDFSSPEMEERYAAFAIACEDFVEDINRTAPVDQYQLKIDDAAMYDVFVSAYHDIARYKEWHLPNPKLFKSDSVKRAAYFAKWIVRLKPISVIRKTYVPNLQDRSVLVNEKFAIEWAFSNLSFELEKEFPIPSETKYFELLYDLHYRSLSEDALLHIFKGYYDLVDPTKQPIFVNLARA